MTQSKFDSEFEGEAILEYGDSDFIILKPGAFVRCAVTGDNIPLAELRYWNVDEQEAYRDNLIATQRWRELNSGEGA
ncbi:DUF2093 domain-containing protein [Maricaulis sp.]|uniref:DUF2093 domain-containing protein n=1 Tax=Maricaulis sp. TaxID=1486257 RepID=UPI00263919EC|nr:DUF2093 domain-containing protein [Maricaulis sp.]